VILAGLLLGGVLAHFFGGSNGPQRPAQTTVAEDTMPAVTPLPSVSPMASPTASPIPTPTSTPTPAKHPAATAKPATPTPAASATPVPSAKPLPSASVALRKLLPVATATPKAIAATSRPVAVATPAPAAPIPAAHPKAAAGDPAASLVRSYLEALAHGDRATASTYLAGGSASETFMSGEAEIESIRSTPGSNSGYQVNADVKSGGVEYYGTFTVVPGPSGLQITDHYWIKPQ
jgi:hypothetical protein